MSAEQTNLELIQDGSFDVTVALPKIILAKEEVECLLRGEIIKVDQLKVKKLDLYINKKKVGRVKLLKLENSFVMKLTDND